MARTPERHITPAEAPLCYGCGVTVHGIFPPIPTPFDRASGDVDRRALASNVRRWMETRLTGILALGSNGEAALLEETEADLVVATTREAMPSDRLLIVGTGRESTRATIAATKRAAALGAGAVLVRSPSFFKAQMAAPVLVDYYTAVADASPVPVLLYNLPGATGVTLGWPVVSQLAEHPNIVGMKETSPELERLGQFVALRDGAFSVLCGWAPVVYPALVSGAAGAILAIANVLPDECVALYDHVVAGRHAEARAAQRRLTTLAQLVTTGHGVPGLKAALEMVGYEGGPARAPLRPLASAARDEIAAAVAAIRTRH
jgi:4-hydroxy-2-oxoglutarate aldolase